VVPCSDVHTFDDIHFEIDGIHFSIPLEVYIIKSFGHCLLGFTAAEFEDNFQNTIILSDAFMRAYYAHFDYGRARIGFALAGDKPPCKEIENTASIEI